MFLVIGVQIRYIFAAGQVCEKYLAKGMDMYWNFMDLEEAYRKIDRLDVEVAAIVWSRGVCSPVHESWI